MHSEVRKDKYTLKFQILGELMKNLARRKYPGLAVLAVATTIANMPDQAMADTTPYLGDIITVGENFCPRGWLSAEGQILPIASYPALFSLLGTIYGGDGRSTFALPDLRGRTAMGQGLGPGLSNRQMGAASGAEAQYLGLAQLPSHSHAVNANNLDGDKPGPGGKLLAAAPSGGTGSETIYSDQPATNQMSSEMISSTGQGQPFNVQDPYLAMRICIATVGIFPPRD